MTAHLQHANENQSNQGRELISRCEPKCLRTYTPTQAVLARSSGPFHWTPEGRRLYDYTSGVLVANLGHHPKSWFRRFSEYIGWAGLIPAAAKEPLDGPLAYFEAIPLTAYNAISTVEAEASRRLVETMQKGKGGSRLQQVMWAASGSEAIQKALWASLARDKSRDIILATRNGFHGKKGLAGAVTGSENDKDRDPRVRFISFPMSECADVSMRGKPFDPTPYQKELDALKKEFGKRITALITEPYLGGGGSYHPPREYLQLLEKFCRDNDVVLILDEIQANFGRCGELFAYQAYGIEPDIVVLGKGLGNGVAVAAAVGRSELFGSLDYGEGSDTYSANPLCCAAVLATLDEFAARDVLGMCHKASIIIEEGLVKLKELPFVAHVRGEKDGMVWGLEMCDHGGKSAADWANAIILACYRGEDGGDGIHILGVLAKKVLRVAPPLTITAEQAGASIALMQRILGKLAGSGPSSPAGKQEAVAVASR
ncbi:MAG: aminotransferase class III-fold pyridoxal phosphate-dependent enzyme [Gemmataceae bacterium]